MSLTPCDGDPCRHVRLTAGEASRPRQITSMAVVRSLKFLFLFLLFLSRFALVGARDVFVITQTNISSQYLTDPDLDLPFTSMLYIAEGSNATADPPMTVRMARIPSSNDTTTLQPTLLVIEHKPGFTIPEAINAPTGLAWHSDYMGMANESLTNNHQLMRSWGAGMIADIWQTIAEKFDEDYIIAKADENILIREIIKEMGLQNTEGGRAQAGRTGRWIARIATKWAAEIMDGVASKVVGTRLRIFADDTAERIDFDLSRPTTPSVSSEGENGYRTISMEKILADDLLKDIHGINPLVLDALQPSEDSQSWRGSTSIPTSEASTSESGTRTPVKGDVETDLTMVREKGVFSTMSLISAKAAYALNEVVFALAISYVIVDYIQGRYVTAALAAMGVVAGRLVPILMDAFLEAGPIGVFLGTGLAMLFFILPGVFTVLPEPPPITNNTQILQYAFFGNKDHTGNERCQQDHPGCVAMYGPGVLNLTMDVEYIDAVFTLLHMNTGLPTSLPDLAAAFPPAISLDKDISPTAPLQISCGNYIGTHTEPNRWGTSSWSNGDPHECNHPKFHVNRDAIMLPNINRTAADVYKDIIGENNPHGSCKIIDNADNPITVPGYGIRIKGLPVAIACGINATMAPTPDSGTEDDAMTPDSNSASNATSVLSGSQSTIMSQSPATSASQIPSPTSLLIQVTHSSSSTALSQILQLPSGPPTPATTMLTSILSSSTLLGIASASVLPSGSSPGSLSTDGRSGEGYIPPPPPSPFLPSLNASNSACFTTRSMKQNFCLPNGTYSVQGKTFGFKSTDIHSILMPDAPNTRLVVQYAPMPAAPGVIETKTYTQNESFTSRMAPDPFFFGTGTFDVLIPNVAPPPVACLFTKPNFLGDVTCVGLGGGNMTEGKNKIASVDILGGATVTLFPNGYGDLGSQRFTVSVPDLGLVPYGTNDVMKGHVAAVLVQGSEIEVGGSGTDGALTHEGETGNTNTQ